ncbi:MAG: helix-turn-helix transcriptional regulator [Sulfuritalea sp.]|nr:helix-turn-helix transcriptional regulator [Sulfuritalea sp.]
MIPQRKTQKLRSLAIEVEVGSGNVYADLGFENAEQMLVKARLAAKIDEIIRRRKLTQAQAAEVLGIPQPKLSNMLRGRFQGISETRLIECLTRLGRNVEIVVKPASRSKAAGRVSVVFA